MLVRMAPDFSKLEAAMVDLDGTLVDTLDDFTAALNGMLHELALPSVTRADIESMVGKGSEHLVNSVLHSVAPTGAAGGTVDSNLEGQPTHALFEKASERYQHHYGSFNGKHSTVYAGVIEGLSTLRTRGLRLACLTNKPTRYAHELLADKGLGGFFDVVFGGDAFERKKPDPLPLVKTCAALGSVVARTLMIGDSSNDAQAARAAGCPVLLVSYGYNHGHPIREVDADGYIDSLAELARFGLGSTTRA